MGQANPAPYGGYVSKGIISADNPQNNTGRDAFRQ